MVADPAAPVEIVAKEAVAAAAAAEANPKVAAALAAPVPVPVPAALAAANPAAQLQVEAGAAQFSRIKETVPWQKLIHPIYRTIWWDS
jgi:hypothetical protein